MKPFKSYEEQLEILKARNLIIEDEKEALEDIKDINYYNIINGYKTPFLKRDLSGVLVSPETFIDNCNFKNLISLYNLDKELKSLLFGYLLEFERTLKSYIAYIFSEEYGKNEVFPYLNFKNFSSNSEDLDIVLSVIKDISLEVKNKKADSIRHYLKQHKELPFWVLINQLTLGNTSYLYEALKSTTKDKIAKNFSLRFKSNYSSTKQITADTLIEVIKISVKFRNICAHDNILLLSKLSKKTKTANIQELLNITNYSGENLYDLICALKLVLKKDSFILLTDSIIKIFKKYQNNFTGVKFEDIISLGGFQKIEFLDSQE
ncbi:Abi family protein [Fusobacterium sp. SB021]|uniref:Abi family protein n=1 Tax=Fusobacterium sp. SB021 TaxID=2744227 RepID=UPI003CF4FD2A